MQAIDSRTTSRSGTRSPQASFDAFVEQAEICCEQARSAARLNRYGAACGLFSTATALYQQATLAAGNSYPSIANWRAAIE